MSKLNENEKSLNKAPKIEYYTPNKTLLTIVLDGIKWGWSVEETLKKCNEWQRERMAAEKEVFGATISRELTEQEVRSARVYINQKLKKRK